MSDFRETLYTVDSHGQRRWVYPALMTGRFFMRRRIVAIMLMAIYLIMPWVEVGGKQAVFLNIAQREFTFFGTTFWATDTRVMALVLLTLGFSLFFFSAVFGRVWCGWACPETIFLEFLFRPIERFIEGGPVHRQRLDNAPWSASKLCKKSGKYLIFAVLAWILASTALAYFLGREQLFEMMAHSPLLNLPMFITTLALMGLTLFQFGWFREQFCSVLCPYARFQSVLLDQHSLIVGYDSRRGEPRAKARAKGGAGDCVDCDLCVRVCPIGIDIRNGTQLECIHCAACVDACDSVMVKLRRAPGLVRYDTEAAFMSGTRRALRPRVVLYSMILALLAAALCWQLTTRSQTDFQVVRGNRDLPFTVLEDGRVTNHLTLHLSNKSPDSAAYRVTIIDNPGISLVVPIIPFPVAPGSTATLPLFFSFPAALLRAGSLPLTIQVTDQSEFQGRQQITLLGPG